MKSKKAIIGCILMLYVLSGCRLAREDMSASKYEDKFVGFFITSEHLDLFDIEGFLNDNIRSGNYSIAVGGNTEKYQGRLYAEIVKDKPYYTFPDIEGISFFTGIALASEGDNDYITSVADEGIDDVKTHVALGDDENSTILTGQTYKVTKILTKKRK